MRSSAAWSAPAMISSGALSPPSASTATRTKLERGAQRHDLAALVGTAGRADVVRPLGRAALRTDVQTRRLERVRRAALVPPGLRGLSLRDSHRGGHCSRTRLRVFAKRLERTPARGRGLLDMLVRLDVQVLAAHGAEAGTVGAAEDLLGEGKRDCVARPFGELELVLDDVGRRHLLILLRAA